MFTILIPTDFSDAATVAANYAAQLASAVKGNLLLLHVYMLPTPVSEMPYMMATADVLQEEKENLATQEAQRLQLKYGIQVEWQVRIGMPSTEINILTEEKTISLIVMGMRGENGVLERFVGSTTTNTLKKVRTPVLVVPENAAFTSINNILISTDFSSEIHDSIFNPVLKLSGDFGSKVTILHVVPEGKIMSPDAIAGKVGLDPVFTNVPHEYEEVHAKGVTEGIQQYLGTHPVDLLVMIAQPHGFIESLFTPSQTRKMAFETSVPLLVLSGKA